MTNILKSIELQNFLSHKNIKINFTKKITLIGGLNGSGKSAVMLGIGLALGQKNLERGTLINFINSKSVYCKIKIVLNNHGNFMHEVFGEEITIIKTIYKKNALSKTEVRGGTQASASQTKEKTTIETKLEIRYKEDKIWSTKVKDLSKIIDFYSLQLNNPLNYLTQENAKKFLNVTNPKTLYQFFLKGTEIEDMKILHDDTKKSAINMQQKILSLKDEIAKLNKELSVKNEKIKCLENVEVYEKEIGKLNIEMEYARLDLTSLQVLEKESKKLRVEHEEYCLLESELIKKHNLIREQLFREEKEMMQTQQTKTNEKNKICEEINELNKQKREIENDISGLDEDIDNLKKRIDDNKKSKDEEDVRKMHQTILTKKEELQKQNKHKVELEEEADAIQVLYTKEEEKIKTANIQINHLKRMVEENKKLNSDNMSYFGEDMHRLIHEVKNTKFKGTVIGPLASEIELKERKWFRPVSIILKNLLGNFIVFEKEDREKMVAMLKKYRVRGCNILVPNNKSDKPISYNKNRYYKTVLDVLDIKSNIVLNQLIILLGIEMIILIEDRQKAHAIVKSKPQFVDCAFTIMGDQIKMFGNSLSDFGKSSNEKYYFENTADKITDLEKKLKDLTGQNLQNIHKQKYIDIKRKINEIDTNSNRLEREIKGLEIDYDAIISTQKKITDDEVHNIRESCEMYVDQKNGLLDALKLIKDEIANKHSILDRNTMDDKQGANDLYVECKKIENELNNATARRNKTSLLMEEKNKEFTVLKDCITSAKKKLLKMGPEPAIVRSFGEVETEINTLKAKIELSKKSIDEIKTKHEIHEIASDIQSRNILIDKNESKILEIYQNAEKRIAKREEIKLTESERAKNDFAKYASLRDYEGDLLFDHDNETLQINLKMKNNIKAGEKGTLSGGERSYASICLLLSLWPSVCCNLKILDEFDVYMDNLNRRCALEMIINYFKNSESQVILITPLDTDQFFNEMCDVVKLKPPRE